MTGELQKVDFSDATKDVEYTVYTRLGQQKVITDVVGTRTFAYNAFGELASETIDGSGGGLYSKTITRNHEGANDPVPGRYTGYTIGNDTVVYGYDAVGRLNRINGPGLPDTDGGAFYGYTANSDLVGSLTYKDASGTAVASATRAYASNRDLLTSVENKTDGATPVSKYTYINDALGRRTAVIYTGSAFATPFHVDFDYNARSELTRAHRRAGEEPDEGANISSPYAFDYAYDLIGNRLTYEVDDSASPTAYSANDLNQYTATAEPAESFGYDADGNLTADGTFAYTWNGESRLIAVEPAGTPEAGDKKLEFAYDYLGRRVEKVVSTHDGSAWSEQSRQRFVYDGPALDRPGTGTSQGWNVVLVLDANNDTQRKYTWGLDLSGTVHAAGGIGGLLAVEETAAQGSPAYWYFYDGNGNVGQLISAGNQTLVAHYEYDPYGNLIVSTGTYADANPFRFSTKWFDTDLAGAGVTGAVGQTGLGYWGYRYYSPRLGRWLNRDPIEEDGGLNLYQYARNDPLRNRDPSGLDACTDGCDSCGNGSTAFCFCVQKCRGTRCWIKAVECSKRAAFSYGVRCTIGCVAGYLWGTPGYKSCLKACALAAAAGRLVVVGACMDEFKACAASANAALDRCLEKAKD